MSAIYLVNGPADKISLVEATNRQVAINHVIKKTVTAKALTALDLASYVKQGLEIEQATAPAEPAPATPTTEKTND